MKIGINTRFLLSNKMEGFGWYTYEVVKRIVQNHPEHSFVLFFDRPVDPKFHFGENATEVVIGPPARHPFLYLIWFEFSLRKAMKKHKIDLLFSPDGSLSLFSNIPQIHVIHDLNFEHFPADLPWLFRWYYRTFFPKFAAKSIKIITVSSSSKCDISETYGVDESKITVAWNGASECFFPISKLDKDQFLSQNGLGDYFVFVGSIHPRKNVQRLINAFTKFQKENNSPHIDLVIVGQPMWKGQRIEIQESMNSKIRFTGHLSQEELGKYVSSALALTYVPYFEGFGIPLVEAMRCGVPILSGDRTSLPEIAGDAAIYCDPFDEDQIADGMKNLFLDGDLRARLSENGLNRSKLFSWDQTAEEVWKVISTEIQQLP